MSKKIITRKNYADTLEKVVEVISSRKVDLDVKHILIVPDKYTLKAEKMIYSGGGAFDVSVMTFNRLFYKLNAVPREYLSKSGAIMLIKKILFQNKDKLQFFTRAVQFNGFAAKLYETINQLFACKAEIDLTKLSGALKSKMQDILLISREYRAATEGRLVDSYGKLEILFDSADNGFFDNAIVYFANFKNPTKQVSRLIEKICSVSLMAYECITTNEYSYQNIEVFSADTSSGELKMTAKKIRSFVLNKGRYFQTAIVASSASFIEVKRILSEYNIPFNIDYKLCLSEHPLSVFLKLLYSVCSRLRRDNVIALTKNFYIGMDKSAVDTFENYVNKYCVDYLAFLEPFTLCDDESEAEKNNLITANFVREKVSKLYRESALFAVTRSPMQFTLCIKNILEFIDADHMTQKLSNIAGQDWAEVTEKISQILSELNNILDIEMDNASIFAAFIEGLSSINLTQLPNLSDSVVIGAPEIFRGSRFKKLFVMGANEGVLPLVSSDCGLISDREIDSLGFADIVVEPKIREVNEKEASEFYDLLSASCDVHISYNTASGNASIPVLEIMEKAEKVTAYTVDEVRDRLLFNAQEQHILEECIGFMGAAELLIRYNQMEKDGERVPYCEDIHSALLSSDIEKYLNVETKQKKYLTESKDIFFRKNTTTVSQIQEYFLCPYKHFFKYGLRLKERDSGELSVLDIGNFLHKVMEIFVRNGRFDDPVGDASLIVDKVADEEVKYRLDANKAVLERLKTESVKLAAIIARQMTGGNFENFSQEARFSLEEKSGFKTIIFPLEKKVVSLKGTIDRIDKCDNALRVIDYKTGRAGFDFTDIYYGKKVQLCLYLAVIINTGYEPAGMFYFPLKSSWGDDEFSHRLDGIYNKEHIISMDRTLCETGVKSSIINARTNKNPDKSGNIVLSASCPAYTRRELCAFTRYAADLSKKGLLEIESGCIAKSPIEGTCDFCEFYNICGSSENKRKMAKIKDTDIINLYLNEEDRR